MRPFPSAAALRPLLTDLVESALQIRDSLPDKPPVSFQLGFTRTPQADTAFLAFEMGPAPYQAGRKMSELGQFDL